MTLNKGKKTHTTHLSVLDLGHFDIVAGNNQGEKHNSAVVPKYHMHQPAVLIAQTASSSS